MAIRKITPRGGTTSERPKVSPLKTAAQLKATVAKNRSTGTGVTKTATNIKTGKTTTEKKALTPITKEAYNANTGKGMRVATKRTGGNSKSSSILSNSNRKKEFSSR